uniref:Cytochrome P450 n=1 Tax=Tetranychus urticae TaxID=32264 RepID=T1KL65_TETUR
MVLFWLFHRFTFWSRQGVPHESLIKSAYTRYTRPLHIADRDTYTKLGRVFGISFRLFEGFRPCLMIGEPEYIRKVLVQEFDKFPNHRIFYDGDQISGKSLVALENDEWKCVRKIMTSLFSTGNLKKMKPSIDRCTSSLIEKLRKQIEISSTVDMKKMMGAYSLDVLASTAFGIECLDSDKTNDVATIVSDFFGHHISIKSIILLWFPFLIKHLNLYVFQYEILTYLKSIVQKIFDRSRLLKSQTNSNENQVDSVNKNFVTLLDEAQIKIKDKELDNETKEKFVIDNGVLLVIAGYDTTATTLSLIIYCLAIFPEHQQKIVDELESLYLQLERTELTIEEINSLDYLNAVIHEVQRYFPVVPRIERRAGRDCTLGTIKLLKDSLVAIPSYAINHDPSFFKNPDQFDPTRFLNNNSEQQTIIPDVFLPFAAGPRSCIGKRLAMLEIKICLISLLTHYRFSVSLETKIPLDYHIGQPVSSPKDVKVIVTPRTRLLKQG